jgi:hypothetical protein
MKPGAFIFLCLAMLFAVSSCKYLGKKKTDDDLLAIAYDAYLYRGDMDGLVPKGLPATDSIEIAKQYIDNWIRQQVLLNHAEGNLEDDQKDFSKQLETYRNSLIVYAYESELIRQKLDTVVNEREIQDFYEANVSNFQLHENIVKVSYVKIPDKEKESQTAQKVRKLLLSEHSDAQVDLMELCDKSMFACRADDGNWIPFTDFIKELSLNITDQEEFLQHKTFMEKNDSLFTYLIRIVDYKTRENTAPVSMVKDKVKNLILNRRKSALIKRMQVEIFEEAMKNKKIEIF